MKSIFSQLASRITFLFAAMFSAVIAFAQDGGGISSSSVTTTETTTTNWYTNPWIWVVGAAIFILLFAAILRGGRRDA